MASMAEKWEELSGKNNWEGLLNPLDLDLRKYIIQYGELAQATYDTFITETASKYAGASRYSMENLFTKAGLDPNKYRVTKFFYATASIPLPDGFIVKSLSREAWSKESNFMGYIAVVTDEGKVALGRRDIVMEEVKRLVEEYKNEDVSITVTGHSLGASIATLNAVDIAFNGINKSSNGKEFPVTAFVFASPKVGDLKFKAESDKLKSLRTLRIHNLLDVVPKYPPIGYFDVGEELLIDITKSPYVRPPGEVVSWHLLEPYLHGVAGTQGLGLLAGFKLEVNRDISLVNKQWNILKDEYCIPGLWWVEKHKGMVQQQDGSWLLLDRDEYEF
ncbi:hypothetical protein CQW23_29990 [Capsicum baccatum]|uniref:Phospholipase A1 n=1 Tax=Capsicum baccatum TaxID=33114 RepID=A0A2G2VBQ2_CAPBA|nr:hypothetical protein CQW23_29990 [Capsicum baccatum]